jgi:hypothetical protein
MFEGFRSLSRRDKTSRAVSGKTLVRVRFAGTAQIVRTIQGVRVSPMRTQVRTVLYEQTGRKCMVANTPCNPKVENQGEP